MAYSKERSHSHIFGLQKENMQIWEDEVENSKDLAKNAKNRTCCE